MSRREFLKTTAVGALALSSIPTIIIPRRTEAYPGGGRVHPNIHPLRVVGLRDPRMTNGENPSPTGQQQEGLVVNDVVYEDIDRLAMALAEEKSAADAWKKVFLKPAGKSWGDVIVAIKTNQIAEQRTRGAVMRKVCQVLTDVMGVKGANVYIYDACHGGRMAQENIFRDLPEGVHVAEKWGGFAVETTVPAPYFNGERKAGCLGPLVKGEVDILVNIALCKGHSPEFGGFTIAMKNHFGTFDPQVGHKAGPTDYLIGLNKSREILGEIDPKTGDVLFPRQQLILVDAIWASQRGSPSGLPTVQSNSLFMGTFCPAVDYVLATRFRKDVLNCALNEQVARRFLSDNGFSESDLLNGGKIIDVSPTAA
jgi:hypothetical protein